MQGKFLHSNIVFGIRTMYFTLVMIILLGIRHFAIDLEQPTRDLWKLLDYAAKMSYFQREQNQELLIVSAGKSVPNGIISSLCTSVSWP